MLTADEIIQQITMMGESKCLPGFPDTGEELFADECKETNGGEKLIGESDKQEFIRRNIEKKSVKTRKEMVEMAKTIKKLTEAQRARFPEIVEKWTKIGLCTDRADRPAFEQAAAACYKLSGLEDVPIVWVESPIVGVIAAPIAARLVDRNTPCKQKVSTIASMLREPLAARDQDAPMGFVAEAVATTVRLAGGQVTETSAKEAVAQAHGEWHYWLWGQWLSGWHAYVDFFRTVCNLELPPDLAARDDAYSMTARSAGNWWPNSAFIMVSDRPDIIHLDDRNRLHSLEGPAIRWPGDGWGVYAVHGVRVPAQVIDAPETMTAQQILTERNSEVRRVMIDRFGDERLMREGHARLLSDEEIPGDQPAKLWRIDLDEDEPMVMVECRCPSTGGRYMLRVPPTITTALEALAWTADLDPDKYVLRQAT